MGNKKCADSPVCLVVWFSSFRYSEAEMVTLDDWCVQDGALLERCGPCKRRQDNCAKCWGND